MEAMESESEGKIHISPDLRYIKDGKYPEVLEKCELVGKGLSFSRCMQEMLFTMLVACFMSIVRLAIDPSLAKISGADLRLAASTSDYYTMI